MRRLVPHRVRGAVAVACAVSALGASFVAASPTASAATDPGSALYATSVRDQCHLPTPGNSAHVLGHDVGWSVRNGNTEYWFFGDTFVDRNSSGVYDGVSEFVTGTIATSDATQGPCAPLTYFQKNGMATAALKPSGANECLTWPMGGVVANNKVYFYYTSVRQNCKNDPNDPDDETVHQHAGNLAVIKSATTLKAKRVSAKMMWPAPGRVYNAPIKANGFIYVFNSKRVSGAKSEVRIGRVAEASIEKIAEYRYRDGKTWGQSEAAATPIITETNELRGYLGAMSVAYNSTFDRWVAVSSCGYLGTAICVRTTTTKGASSDNLVKGWNESTVLYDSAGVAFDCYHGAQHAGFADGATILVSNARFGGKPWARPQHYWVTLRSITLGTEPMPFTRETSSGERSFRFDGPAIGQGQVSVQGRDGWSYMSWPDNQPLTWDAATRSWIGNELVGTDPAPAIGADTMRPSATRRAARVFHVSGRGTVSIDGEAWLEQTCGTGANVEILLQHAGVVTSLRQKTLNNGWVDSRSRFFHIDALPVAAGDDLIFTVDRWKDANCDRIFWNPEVTFDADHELVRSSRADLVDMPAQGDRQWREQTCAVDFGIDRLSQCVDMPNFSQNANGPLWTGDVAGYIIPDGIAPPFSAGVTTRSWVAPVNGHVHATAHLSDLQPTSACPYPDDGAQVAVFVGDTQRVWPAGPSWMQIRDAQADLTLDLDLTAGTPLRFVVSGGTASNSVCDQTGLDAHLDFTWT